MGFCENCGKELADGEQCTCTVEETVAQEPVVEEAVADGAPDVEPAVEAPVAEETSAVAEAPAVTETSTEEPAKEMKPGMDKKKLTILGAAVAAVVVLLLLVVLLAGGSKGYMGPVEDFMAEINKQNTEPVDVYSTLLPDFAADLYAQTHKKYKVSDEYMDYYEDSIKYLEDYYDDCNDEYDKWKLSFESKKATKMDEDDLEDIQDYLDDYYDDYLEDEADYFEDALEDEDDIEDAADELDISESQVKTVLKANLKYVKAYEELKVTAGYEVKGRFIVKAGKDEFKTETVEFRVVKINGDWTYWGVTSGSLNFDDDEEDCFSFIANFLSSKRLYKGF